MENRVLKFRAWDKWTRKMIHPNGGDFIGWHAMSNWKECLHVMQYTGLKDKNGVEVYEGDILEFADKWEWYRTSYGIKMRFAEPERRAELQKQYDAEPMERRVIEIPECYEWILSSEIQTYWRVIGNKFQHPHLLNQQS